jgi:hypothetical protein
LNKNQLEYLIAKSEARYLRLEEMEAPEEVVQMELAHLSKLIQAKLDKEKYIGLLGGKNGRNHC